MNNSISINNNQGDTLGVGIRGNGNIIAKEVSLNLLISANDQDSQETREIKNKQIKLEDLASLINKTKNPNTETKVKGPNRIQRAIGRIFQVEKRWKEKSFGNTYMVKIGDSEISLNEYIKRLTLQIGNDLINKREYYEAIKVYNLAFPAGIEDIDIVHNKGVALGMLGRYDEAISCYDKALAMDPNYIFALNNKGSALVILGRYDEANKYFDRALDLDPKNVRTWYNKGTLFNQSKKYN
jgi:tetratricopeptide (TPR) repeat protein